MSGTYNTSALQNERWFRRFRYLNDDDSPIDISSYTARMQIRTHDKGPLVAEAVCTNGGGNGTVEAEVPAATTLLMDARQYFYDIWLDNIPLAKGVFEVQQGMTKPEVV